jgi:hypothetical protein
MEKNTKFFLVDMAGWGIGLWFIGYVLGIVLFMFVPANLLGWAISPIGILITVWVLIKKINAKDMLCYLKIAVAWMVIAVIFDYLFLVLLFRLEDGYYKLDIYFYYVVIFLLPLLVGIFKTKKSKEKKAVLSVSALVKKQAKDKADNKQKILKFLEGKEKITNNNVENFLGVSNATAERYLDELEKEGVLKQVGDIGQGVYYVKI